MSTPFVPSHDWLGDMPPQQRPRAHDPVAPSAARPLPVASLRRRAGAYAIDIAVAAAVSAVCSLVLLLVGAAASGGSFSVNGSVDSDATSSDLLKFAALGFVTALGPLLAIGLLPTLSGTWRGRTVGKRALDLRVIRADGHALSGGSAFRRALALFGPGIVALVLGPVLDAAASTPPLFTFLLLTASLIYGFGDLVAAPGSGLLRRTLHDRLAGTVVVDVRHLPPFDAAHGEPTVVTPQGRAKTTGTWVGLSALGALYAVATIIFLLAALVDGGSSSSSSDSLASSTATQTPVTASLHVDDPPYLLVDFAIDEQAGEVGAQRNGIRLGALFLGCLQRTQRAADCATAAQIGLPSGETLVPVKDFQGGDPSDAGKMILTSLQVLGQQRVVVGIEDDAGTLWGIGVTSSLDVNPICISAAAATTHCSVAKRDPQAGAFIDHRSVTREVVRLAAATR